MMENDIHCSGLVRWTVKLPNDVAFKAVFTQG
jgi:hypothetical protein